ncbi:hypothetical protein [Aurantivibrio infirmus]
MLNNQLKIVTTGILLLCGQPLLASELTVPNTFVAGQAAVADEVNANFTAVKSAVDDNNSRITDHETRISNNTTEISNNQSMSQMNADAIDTLTSSNGVGASSANNSSTLSATDTVVRTLTILPPADGLLIVNATAWFKCTSTAACVARCSINPGGTTIDTTRFAISSVASNQYQTMAITGNLPATTDTPIVLNMVCDTFAGGGQAGDASITAAFSATDLTQ